MPHQTFTSTSSAVTRLLGKKIARALKGGEVLLLKGNLGSGKTTFVKGLAKGLGVKQIITSPTFVLMKVYPVKRRALKRFVHVDCYRLPAARLSSSFDPEFMTEGPKSGRQGVPGVELSTIGLSDYLGKPDAVVAVEWAEKLHFARRRSVIRLKFAAGKKTNERNITITV